jgi:hypothetical protein
MLDLASRSDLNQLGDTELAERLDLAYQANDSMRKRFGYSYYFYSLSWMPRIVVRDPRDYWYPSHVLLEIQDILKEMKQRVAKRKVDVS